MGFLCRLCQECFHTPSWKSLLQNAAPWNHPKPPQDRLPGLRPDDLTDASPEPSVPPPGRSDMAVRARAWREEDEAFEDALPD